MPERSFLTMGEGKVISWLKRFMQSSRRRAEIMAQARQMLAEMAPRDEYWAEQARKPLGEVQEMLMRMGLAGLMAIKTAQEFDLERQTRLKEDIWRPIEKRRRN